MLKGNSTDGSVIRWGAGTPHPPNPPHTGFGSSLYTWFDTYFGSPWVKGSLPASQGTVRPVSSTSALQTALTNAVSGDIIQIANGTYTGQIDWENHTYSASNPVTIMPAPGATVNISETAPSHLLYMRGIKGVRILNINFTGAYECCIKIDSGCQDIEINGCTMSNFSATNIGHGILAAGGIDRLAIINTTTHTGKEHGMYLGSYSQTTIGYGISGLLVMNCLTYDNTNGYDTNSGGMGIQAGDSLKHARIISCTSDNNGFGGTTHLNPASGYTFFTQGEVKTAGDEQGTDVAFYNCIASNNAQYGWLGIGSAPNRPTNLIEYMLNFNNGAGTLLDAGMAVIGSPNFTGDPKYVNRAGKDFHLAAGSAAVGIGKPEWMPETDLDGNTRVTADVGCYRA